LHSVYAAIGDPPEATAWLLDVTSVAPNPSVVLADIVDVPWIPLAQHGPILQRILDAKQNALAKAEGLEKENAQSELRSWQNRWMRYLIDSKQFNQAGEYLASLSREQRSADAAMLVPVEMRVAAQLGTLDAKLESYRSDSQAAPAAEPLTVAARELFEAGDKRSARKILEFVFAREIEEHQLVAANFLGLAEIRIADGDTDGAVNLLHRLVLVVGDPYQNMDSAAALLEKTGHSAEAVEFLGALTKATPWEPGYRLRLAKAQIAVARSADEPLQWLAAIASAPQNPYSVRVQATLALSGMHRGADASLRDITWTKRHWQGAEAYAESKLYDVLLAFAVARRWPDVLSNALEPGWVPTKMGGPAHPTTWIRRTALRFGWQLATIQVHWSRASTSTTFTDARRTLPLAIRRSKIHY